MDRRQDSRMISEMKDQLKRLQERRQELESRQVEDEAILQPIVPHLARVMRDRQWAQVRSMVQRNMDSIDGEIQESIGRIGSALLESPVSRTTQQHFPDLIPMKPIKSREPQHGCLPRPGSSARQVLLETVKETLERRKKPQEDERKDLVQQSPRVGFYQFRHETGFSRDKLSRLSVQKLPSVTIATAERHLLNHVISVQSDRIDPVEAETFSMDIQPDDVAQLVSDILAGQLELAVDSLDPATMQQPGRSQHDNNDDDEFRLLTIDSCTQTAIRSVKDSSTMADVWHNQTDRAVGPDLPILSEPDTEEVTEFSQEEEEEEVETSLTPPRSCIAADPMPPLDWNLWRRRYPTTPPSASCSESVIKEAATAHESSTTTTGGGSSDATGISSSIATTSSSSVDDVVVSWMSDGQVPNRVASPGQVHNYVHRSAADVSQGQILLRDPPTSLHLASTMIEGSSEGEIFLPPSRSNSTTSFQSAAGSLGEIHYTTQDFE